MNKRLLLALGCVAVGLYLYNRTATLTGNALPLGLVGAGVYLAVRH